MPEVARTPTSARNPLLKDIRRAALRGTLTEDGFALAETFHLLEEALRSDCEIKLVLAAESVHSTVEAHVRGLPRLKVLVLADSVFQALSTTEASQGIIALVRPPSWTLDQLFRGQSLVAVLDGIQDPGNAGAIVRAAEAFGASGVFFVKGSVSPWNPKTLRASAGSLFRVPHSAGLGGDLVRTALEQRRLDIYAAMPGAHQRSLGDLDLTRKCAFLIGNEGRGLSDRLRSGAIDIRIPTKSVESLNAAMAAGILLYEAARQRLLRP
ncbi:MAG TPA: RNA methyltransferase [Solibacterales bacterium]|nr:RNA methyltransferase [Bryobacterales bacterium]